MPWLRTQSSISHLAIVNKNGLFLNRHCDVITVQSLTSREREVLALWRHIRRFYLHAQIGTKAIFTSEYGLAKIRVAPFNNAMLQVCHRAESSYRLVITFKMVVLGIKK